MSTRHPRIPFHTWLVLVVLLLLGQEASGGKRHSDLPLKSANDLQAEAIDMLIKLQTNKITSDHFLDDFGTVLLVHALLHDETRKSEGNSGEIPEQTHLYQALAKQRKATTICETGFNMGHSALNWLLHSAPGAQYYGFDAGAQFHAYAEKNAEFINQVYSAAQSQHNRSDTNPQPIRMVWGDSTQTLPRFIEDNPRLVCDLIHVDGGHYGPVPAADLANLCHLASADSLVIIDDVNCQGKPATDPRSGCVEPERAWRAAQSAGAVRETACYRFTQARGFCFGTCRKPREKPRDSFTAIRKVHGLVGGSRAECEPSAPRSRYLTARSRQRPGRRHCRAGKVASPRRPRPRPAPAPLLGAPAPLLGAPAPLLGAPAPLPAPSQEWRWSSSPGMCVDARGVAMGQQAALAGGSEAACSSICDPDAACTGYSWHASDALCIPHEGIIGSPWLNGNGDTSYQCHAKLPVQAPTAAVEAAAEAPTEACDWNCYLDRYSDVAAEYGMDVVMAEKHYELHGRGEKRDCTCPVAEPPSSPEGNRAPRSRTLWFGR